MRDVLVWTKRPFLLRNELVPGDFLAGERPAGPGDVKRLGDHAAVIQITTGAATVEIAARAQHRDRLRGPYGDRIDEAGNAVSLMQSRKSG